MRSDPRISATALLCRNTFPHPQPGSETTGVSGEQGVSCETSQPFASQSVILHYPILLNVLQGTGIPALPARCLSAFSLNPLS